MSTKKALRVGEIVRIIHGRRLLGWKGQIIDVRQPPANSQYQLIGVMVRPRVEDVHVEDIGSTIQFVGDVTSPTLYWFSSASLKIEAT